MVAVPHVSRWRVRRPTLPHGVRPYSLGPTPGPYAGDVSLSAEDKPPSYFIYRPPAIQLPPAPSMHHDTTPNDADDGDDADDDLLQEHHHMEDEHHNWLGGATALKFLAAGGVAGAGQRFLCTFPPQHVSLSVCWTVNSVADIHSSV
jgi:hypothetical protein